MKLVIDTSVIAWRVRRAWFALLSRWFVPEPSNCATCGKPLSAIERHYYECHCELCESALWASIEDS